MTVAVRVTGAPRVTGSGDDCNATVVEICALKT
jgi:hypothetical protein